MVRLNFPEKRLHHPGSVFTTSSHMTGITKSSITSTERHDNQDSDFLDFTSGIKTDNAKLVKNETDTNSNSSLSTSVINGSLSGKESNDSNLLEFSTPGKEENNSSQEQSGMFNSDFIKGYNGTSQLTQQEQVQSNNTAQSSIFDFEGESPVQSDSTLQNNNNTYQNENDHTVPSNNSVQGNDTLQRNSTLEGITDSLDSGSSANLSSSYMTYSSKHKDMFYDNDWNNTMKGNSPLKNSTDYTNAGFESVKTTGSGNSSVSTEQRDNASTNAFQGNSSRDQSLADDATKLINKEDKGVAESQADDDTEIYDTSSETDVNVVEDKPGEYVITGQNEVDTSKRKEDDDDDEDEKDNGDVSEGPPKTVAQSQADNDTEIYDTQAETPVNAKVEDQKSVPTDQAVEGGPGGNSKSKAKAIKNGNDVENEGPPKVVAESQADDDTEIYDTQSETPVTPIEDPEQQLIQPNKADGAGLDSQSEKPAPPGAPTGPENSKDKTKVNDKGLVGQTWKPGPPGAQTGSDSSKSKARVSNKGKSTAESQIGGKNNNQQHSTKDDQIKGKFHIVGKLPEGKGHQDRKNENVSDEKYVLGFSDKPEKSFENWEHSDESNIHPSDNKSFEKNGEHGNDSIHHADDKKLFKNGEHSNELNTELNHNKSFENEEHGNESKTDVHDKTSHNREHGNESNAHHLDDTYTLGFKDVNPSQHNQETVKSRITNDIEETGSSSAPETQSSIASSVISSDITKPTRSMPTSNEFTFPSSLISNSSEASEVNKTSLEAFPPTSTKGVINAEDATNKNELAKTPSSEAEVEKASDYELPTIYESGKDVATVGEIPKTGPIDITKTDEGATVQEWDPLLGTDNNNTTVGSKENRTNKGEVAKNTDAPSHSLEQEEVKEESEVNSGSEADTEARSRGENIMPDSNSNAKLNSSLLNPANPGSIMDQLIDSMSLEKVFMVGNKPKTGAIPGFKRQIKKPLDKFVRHHHKNAHKGRLVFKRQYPKYISKTLLPCFYKAVQC